MNIDFSPINFTLTKKPLLVGGKAMEYYGLRKAGADIDLIVSKDDLAGLIKLYPNSLKDLWGDFGVAIHGFEIWKTIRYLDYDYMSDGAVEEENFLVISLEKLLLQKALAMDIPKYRADLELIIKRMNEDQYKNFDRIQKENADMLKGIPAISYVEKKGPEDNSRN